jgi:hypothetical protein
LVKSVKFLKCLKFVLYNYVVYKRIVEVFVLYTILVPECVIPDDVLIQVGPPDDEHLLLETCRGMK